MLLELSFCPLHRLREIQIGPEKKSICALELAHDVVGESIALQTHAIQSIQFHRIAHRLEERRNVLRDTRAPANETVTSDTHKLMHGRQSRDGRLVVYSHMTRELNGIRHDHAISDMTVVCEVNV